MPKLTSGFVANSKYKIQALFEDLQGPKLHFSSTKIIDKKPYPRHGDSKFRLQCDTEVYCTILTNTVMIKASDRLLFPSTGHMYTSACFKMVNECKISKFARFKFKDFSRIFKHLICFQALSRALKFFIPNSSIFKDLSSTL